MKDILFKKAAYIRRVLLSMAVGAGSAHLAPSFSCVDILVALYHGGVLRVNPKKPKWSERDRFILSKGHAAMALYAVLSDVGFFSKRCLMGFGKDGTTLGAHPEGHTPGVDVLTGSLGHGLSVGAGLALGAKLSYGKYLSVVLMGDGECQEGTVWEAAMFAAHHHLDNLIAIVDYNGLCATDTIKGCLEIAPLEEKWRAFGWEVECLDGHSFEALLDILGRVRLRKSRKPLIIIASTVKGKGVSFMENTVLWHYRVPLGEKLRNAIRELSSEKKTS